MWEPSCADHEALDETLIGAPYMVAFSCFPKCSTGSGFIPQARPASKHGHHTK
jgi:hypothetical protein